jgi:hypothetical protein
VTIEIAKAKIDASRLAKISNSSRPVTSDERPMRSTASPQAPSGDKAALAIAKAGVAQPVFAEK